MNLQEWDTRVAPHLRCISSCCAWIGLYGSKLKIALELLPARPAWETKARGALNALEINLRMLLAETQKMQREYDRLPVIIESYSSDSFSHFVGTENEDEQLRFETETGAVT